MVRILRAVDIISHTLKIIHQMIICLHHNYQ
nr:MAG TPA_asm: hypothetical protein [Bacteriophage sp.]